MGHMKKILIGSAIVCAACVHSSSVPEPSRNRVVNLRPHQVVAALHGALVASGFRIIAEDSSKALIALREIAGNTLVHCTEIASSRAASQPPREVLVVLATRDTLVDEANVRVEVTGWRAGEMPPLAVGVGSGWSGSMRGPCLTTHALEDALFKMLDETASQHGRSGTHG
jgi:hypothetical protein